MTTQPTIIVGHIGPQGPPGPALNVLGTVASDAVLPQSGNIGDVYLVEDTDLLWVYGSNGWVALTAGAGTALTSETMTYPVTTASATWVIEHTFAVPPSVTIVNDDGDLVHGSVHYDSPIQVTVSFNDPVRGIAYLRP